MKKLPKHYLSIFFFIILSTSCELASYREIQRFKDAPRDPQLVDMWYFDNRCFDFRSDGTFTNGQGSLEYYYTENAYIYFLQPSENGRKARISKEYYRIENDTLYLMYGSLTKTMPTLSHTQIKPLN